MGLKKEVITIQLTLISTILLLISSLAYAGPLHVDQDRMFQRGDFTERQKREFRNVLFDLRWELNGIERSINWRDDEVSLRERNDIMSAKIQENFETFYRDDFSLFAFEVLRRGLILEQLIQEHSRVEDEQFQSIRYHFLHHIIEFALFQIEQERETFRIFRSSEDPVGLVPFDQFRDQFFNYMHGVNRQNFDASSKFFVERALISFYILDTHNDLSRRSLTEIDRLEAFFEELPNLNLYSPNFLAQKYQDILSLYSQINLAREIVIENRLARPGLRSRSSNSGDSDNREDQDQRLREYLRVNGLELYSARGFSSFVQRSDLNAKFDVSTLLTTHRGYIHEVGRVDTTLTVNLSGEQGDVRIYDAHLQLYRFFDTESGISFELVHIGYESQIDNEWIQYSLPIRVLGAGYHHSYELTAEGAIRLDLDATINVIWMHERHQSYHQVISGHGAEVFLSGTLTFWDRLSLNVFANYQRFARNRSDDQDSNQMSFVRNNLDLGAQANYNFNSNFYLFAGYNFSFSAGRYEENRDAETDRFRNHFHSLMLGFGGRFSLLPAR